MKKIFGLDMLLCFMALTPVQAQTTRGKSLTTDEIMQHLEELVDKFCHYVEVIGSTGSVSEAEKNRIRRREVPELFYRWDERRMKTTGGADGTILRSPKMKDYFYNLQDQAKEKITLNSETKVMYDLEFYFLGNANDNLKWKEIRTYEDGIVEYEAKVMIYQTYIKETVSRGGNREMKRSREEVDAKEMTIKKLVMPNNEELYKLGDITKAERLATSNR